MPVRHVNRYHHHPGSQGVVHDIQLPRILRARPVETWRRAMAMGAIRLRYACVGVRHGDHPYALLSTGGEGGYSVDTNLAEARSDSISNSTNGKGTSPLHHGHPTRHSGRAIWHWLDIQVHKLNDFRCHVYLGVVWGWPEWFVGSEKCRSGLFLGFKGGPTVYC